MAIDILDMLRLGEERRMPGDRLPIEALFRAIQERWSVVPLGVQAISSGQVTPVASAGIYPLDYDRYPTTWDRLDAIRRNIVALGPHFVIMDAERSRFDAWMSFPLVYTEEEIARKDARVLMLPARGSAFSPDENAELYEGFLFSAASWLSRFRYVNAAPYTWVESFLSRNIGLDFSTPCGFATYGPTGQTVADHSRRGVNYTNSNPPQDISWPESGGGPFGEAFQYLDFLSSPLGAEATTAAITDHWCCPSTGFRVTGTGSASFTNVKYWELPRLSDEYARWGNTVEASFSLSGVPSLVRVFNAAGYQADALFVHAASLYETTRKRIEEHRGSRNTITKSTLQNEVLREVCYDGTWLETRRDTWDGSRHAWVERIYRPDGTNERIVDSGDEADSEIVGVFHIVSVTRPHVETLGKLESRTDGEMESASDHIERIGTILAREGALLRLGERATSGGDTFAFVPDIDPATLLREIQPLAALDPSTPPGLRDVLIQVDGGCRLVPILDYGAVYKINDDEELENWAGLSEEDWNELHPPSEEETAP